MSDRQLIADLLSALEYHTEQTRPIEFSRVAIEAAREYLRKPAQQQEPVKACVTGQCACKSECDRAQCCLYTSQPASKPWVGLTKKEVYDLYESDYAVFYQRIEAKLKEKNT